MPTKGDLIGMGMNAQLANIIGNSPVLTSAVGATVGSATPIGPYDYTSVVLSGTSGLRVPEVQGGNKGSPFYVANLTAATIAVYAATNAAGSAVTFYSSAASGVLVSVAIGKVANLLPISASSWLVMAGASAG